MRIAVVGAGWAGLAAAVTGIEAGHQVSLYEASRTPGGRARAVPGALPDGTPTTLDNGQHILIGAYSHTLALMRTVGVAPEHVLLRLPLTLCFPDGNGIQLPYWSAPWDALAGILGARGWHLADKWSLLRLAVGWRRTDFHCASDASVAQVCQGASARVLQELIEPLCVSALNLDSAQASGSVFLRVLRDALFGAPGASNLLLPQVDLGRLLPDAAVHWLAAHGANVHLASRVQALAALGNQWQIGGDVFDRVILATPAADSVRILHATTNSCTAVLALSIARWIAVAQTLRHTAITTVYAFGAGVHLPHPMLALRSASGPAQFVFDRGQLGGPTGLLAFVVSASTGERDALQEQVLRQAQAALGLKLQPLQTVVEKRAAFACTPGLMRPPAAIAPGLSACADFVEGPYPSTLEGAVRAGMALRAC